MHTWIEFSSDSAYAFAHQFIVDWDVIETRERELLAERLAGGQESYPDVTMRRVVTRDRVPCHRLACIISSGRLPISHTRSSRFEAR